MQLKTVGESINVTKTIDNIISKTSAMSKSMSGFKLQTIQLAEGLSGYSTEAIKTAISQSTLNKTQIEAILSTKGLTGEILETTASELAQTTATNALSASQKKATISANTFALAMKGLGKKFLNLFKGPIGWIILAATTIAGVVTAVKTYNAKIEEAKQTTHDLGKEARDAVEKINSSFESTKQTVNDVKEKYAELAQGVKNLGTSAQSQGTLSTSEYEEFLDISNQLAELFPELTVGYDENGNAILKLNGDVQTITSSLDELLDRQRKLNAEEIGSKMGDIFKDYRLTTSDYAKDYNDISETKSKNINSVIDDLINNDKINFRGMSKEEINAFEELLQDNGIDLEDFYSKSANNIKYSDKEKDIFKSIGLNYQNEYSNQLNDLATKIDAENKQFGEYVVQSFQNNGLYQEISEKLGANGTNLVNSIFTNLGYDTLLSQYSDWDEASKYLEDSILSKFTNLSDTEIADFQETYASLLRINPDKALAENLPLYEQYINKLAEILQIDAEQIEIAFGVNIDDKNQLLNSAKDRLGFNENASNSNEAQHNQEINDFVNSLNEEDLNILLNLTIPKKAYNYTSEQLHDWFDKTQNQLDKTPVVSRVELETNADNLNSAFDDLRNAYSDYLENGLDGLDISNITKLNNEDTFGNINGSTAAYERFLSVMQDMDATAEDVQDAFDTLASEYIYHSKLAEQITDSNVDWIESELKKNGVINSSAVAEQMLVDKYGAETASISECVRANLSLNGVKLTSQNASQVLANASYKSIDALIAEANAAGISATALANYELDKIASSKTTITTDGDIANLVALCNTMSDTGTLMEYLIELKNAYNRAMNSNEKIAIETQINSVVSQIKSKIRAGTQRNTVSSGSSGSSGSGGSSGSSSSSTEKTEELFDWIERRIEKFQTNFDRWVNQAESAISSSKIGSYYKKASSSLTNLLKTYESAVSYYAKEANKSGLSEKYKKKVQSGLINIESITDDSLKEQINTYQDYYDKSTDALDEFISTAEQLYNIPLDKAAEKIEIFEDSIDSLDKKLDNTIGASAKNSIIDQQTKLEKNILSSYKTASKETKKNLSQTGKTVTKSNLLNSDDGITKKEKKKIQQAVKNKEEINLSYYTEGSAGYKAAVKYNEALKSNVNATKQLADAQQEYKSWLVESAKLKFDNIADDYENKIQLLNESVSAIDRKITETEQSGKAVDKSYYQKQKKNNDSVKKQYDDELKKLQKQISTIKKGTDEWYEAREEIEDVKDSISECVQKTYELNNEINQLHFDLFDDIREQLDRIVTEYQFLTSLIKHEDNFNSETGLITDAGITNLGASSINYSVYKQKAEEDKKLVTELQSMVNKGVLSNSDFTFNSLDDLQEKLDEVYSTWQSDIQETYSAEEEIVSIMTEKYETLLDVMQELIDAKKDSLQAEKDLHDYQKTVSEQVNDINTLQKQIAAYQGDTSQEGVAKLQNLQKQLLEAQETLDETEYDKYISDQEEMLDTLYTEYEELISKKLDDFYGLVNEGVSLANNNLSNISSNLQSISKDYKYTQQFSDLTNALKTSNGNLENTVSNKLDSIISILERNSGTENKTSKSSSSTSSSNSSKSSSSSSKSSNSTTSSAKNSAQTIAKVISATKDVNAVRLFLSKNVKKASKKSEYSDVNKVIYDQFNGKVLSGTGLKDLAKMLGVKYDNAKKSGKLYKKLKSIKFPGFKRGGVVSVDSLEKQLSENGDSAFISVNKGERILTEEQNRNFEKLINSDMLKNIGNVD